MQGIEKITHQIKSTGAKCPQGDQNEQSLRQIWDQGLAVGGQWHFSVGGLLGDFDHLCFIPLHVFTTLWLWCSWPIRNLWNQHFTEFIYLNFSLLTFSPVGFPRDSDGKESACNAGGLGSIPELWRSPGGGHGNPLQYSCLKNPHGQKGLTGSSESIGSQRVRHDWVTKHSWVAEYKRNPH